ncbi:MAG: hypothetical protein WD273_08095 [Trueperaceae bacterium]
MIVYTDSIIGIEPRHLEGFYADGPTQRLPGSMRSLNVPGETIVRE